MDTTTTTLRSARLRLTPEVAETIRGCSFDGLKALPRRGAEIGGLIVATGRLTDEGEEVRLVPCEYLYGPSYHLSARDLPEVCLAKSECEAEGKTLVAYFRSCTRPVMRVEPEDREAIAFVCPDVPFVVLAKPAMSGAARILIFSRNAAGEWTPGEEWELPAPFRVSRAPAPPPIEPPIEEIAPVPPAPPVAAPKPMVPLPLPHPSGTRAWRAVSTGAYLVSDRRQLILFASGGLLVIVIGAALWFRVRSATPPAHSSASPVAEAHATSANDPKLDLAVRDENGRLHLTWNRNSPTAASAVSGELRITDSDKVRSIPLRPADITGGSIVYSPRTPDVTFRLQMTNSEGKVLAEMIRVVGNGPAIRQVASNPVERPVQPPISRAGSVPAPMPEFHDTPSPIEIKREVPRPVQSSPPPVTPTEKAPVTATEKAPVTATQKAPEPQATTAQPSSSQTSTAPPVTAAAPVTTPPVSQPADLPRPAPPVQTAPAPIVTQRQEISTTPPVPVHQVMPTRKAGPYWNIYTPVKVGVLVSIDEKGRVRKVRADDSVKSSNPFLLSVSVAAAREWTFKPATQGGKPITGEYRIEFLFQPDKRAP